ncbi:MAG: 50S ribosomal protein L24 [Candidatus Levybacteria bacterium RBG_16_35_6]|nr:MAG: 50S ribosomal protein L24 [Candidatus Levybacteria bacterium RBG_16_35_6]
MSKVKNQKSKVKTKKIKKGDEVIVLLGKDKGKKGKIEAVFTKENKIVVAGVNQYKRHMKRKSEKQPSEIITLTKPLPISNVSVICPKCHLPTRVGLKKEKDKTIRICKKCQQEI